MESLPWGCALALQAGYSVLLVALMVTQMFVVLHYELTREENRQWRVVGGSSPGCL